MLVHPCHEYLIKNPLETFFSEYRLECNPRTPVPIPACGKRRQEKKGKGLSQIIARIQGALAVERLLSFFRFFVILTIKKKPSN